MISTSPPRRPVDRAQGGVAQPGHENRGHSFTGGLLREGLEDRTGTGARNRREYGITDAGRAELRRWLTDPGLDLAFRSAALLRVFFLWTLSRQDGTAYLERFAQVNRDRLAALETIRDHAEWVGDPAQICGWLILEFGIRGSRNAEEWAGWAAEQLTEHLP